MPNFPIIDSHVHFIDPRRFSYGWLGAKPAINRPFLPADFESRRGDVQVAATVFVEAWADGGQGVAEARFAQDLVAAGAPLAGIVACVPVTAGAAMESALTALRQLPHLCGARYLIEGAVDPSFCLEPTFIEGVQRIGEAGLPFDLCLKHWALPFATELARRVPGTIFVLDHIGKPGIKHGLREPWWTGIAEIARLPNVRCKLSGVITEADHATWSEAQIRPYAERAIECFGFDRLMFGSDWPVSELTHRYAQWVEILDRILAGCSAQELRSVYRDTAVRTYGLAPRLGV